MSGEGPTRRRTTIDSRRNPLRTDPRDDENGLYPRPGEAVCWRESGDLDALLFQFGGDTANDVFEDGADPIDRIGSDAPGRA
jgi:hypothetical protein